MYERCAQCKCKFKENSIQYHRRLREGHPILCQECYRISMAGIRAEKRKRWLSTKEEDIISLEKFEREGTLCISLLRMKLKLSYEAAKKIIDDYYRLKVT